ncbi:MAG: RluA family pseudouridine synthase [Clostridia bacterium]|nr:RluA family pseudouridine synthase [Clostridia bacterium]
MSGRTLTCTISGEQEGLRVRSLLKKEMGLSNGLISRVKQQTGAVRLNGKPARTIDVVHAGDVLSAEVGDTRAGGRFTPISCPLEILYEDEDLLVINKPAGMATHGGAKRGEATVANAIAAYLGTENPFHPVNRLDRGTTGVMCVAKTGYIHDRLRRKLHSESFLREYLALAVGIVTPRKGVIDLPVARTGDKMFGVCQNGAPSLTRYETIGTGGGLTLLKVRPETGRTHQIRVHFAALGYPLFGDRVYGREAREISRPALHSRALYLIHPVSGKAIAVSAPLPADIKEVLARHAIQAYII